MVETADVVIVGGGLHGCSAALHLARRGVASMVIEKDHVGRHASGVNAGGVRRLGRDLAEVPLSAASIELWHGIEDLVDDGCGFHPTGQVKGRFYHLASLPNLVGVGNPTSVHHSP